MRTVPLSRASCAAAVVSVVLSLTLFSQACQAHLMVAQHGTLNFVGDSAYLVVSLPVSAIDFRDANRDGKLSVQEFQSHRLQIAAQVEAQLQLLDGEQTLMLQGLMLSLAADHDAPLQPSEHLIVMGRFELQPTATAVSLRLRSTLFGDQVDRQIITMTAKRNAGAEVFRFELQPQASEVALFVD